MKWNYVKLQSDIWVCITQRMRLYEMSRCYPTCRCSLCVVAIRKKKKESNHIPWQDIKKKNKKKLTDTNSLSEGSLRIVNERAQFSGGKKIRDNLCHAKVAASTENDNDYNSIRVYLRREKLYQFLISNGAVQRNAFLSQCWNWYRFFTADRKAVKLSTYHVVT